MNVSSSPPGKPRLSSTQALARAAAGDPSFVFARSPILSAISNLAPLRIKADPAKRLHLSFLSPGPRIIPHLLLMILLPMFAQAAGQRFVLNAGQSLVLQFQSLPPVDSEHG